MSKGSRYTVYDRNTDLPVASFMSASECARAMGISRDTFYIYAHRCRMGVIMRWNITTHDRLDGLLVERSIDRITLPPMLKTSDIQNILGITYHYAQRIFDMKDFPGVKAGRRKINIVPREQFFEWLDKNTGKELFGDEKN